MYFFCCIEIIHLKPNYFNTATLKTNYETKSDIPEGSENTRDMFIFGVGTFGDGDVSGGFIRFTIVFGGRFSIELWTKIQKL
jgi:hypothetical protein